MYTDKDIKIVKICELKIDNKFFKTSVPNTKYVLWDSTDLLKTEAWSLGFYSVATKRPQAMPATISTTYVYLYLVFA